ncbi:hypothetical protein Hanom_Chr07g00663701 [Helianthus anomalus]
MCDIGMAKITEPDGYTRNPTQIERVYPIPDGYWAGYGISIKNLRVWVEYGIR